MFMVIGNLPDFDFLIGFACGRPGLIHRGVSHTILAAAAFGVLAGIVARRRGGEAVMPTALAGAAAYASHLLLDWLTSDARPPEGAQFLWPFSDAYYIAPVALFREIRIDGLTREGFVGSVLGWPTVLVLAREAVLVLGAVALWRAAEAAYARRALAALRPRAGSEDAA